MKKLWMLLCAAVLITGCRNAEDKVPEKPVKLPTETVVQSSSPTQNTVQSVARQVDPNDTTPVKIYPFEHALFKFKIGGPGVKSGEMTFAIDDFGNLESKRSTKIKTSGRETETWTIKKSYNIYSLNTAVKEMVKTRMDQRISANIDLESLIQEHGSHDKATQYLSDTGITLLPDEELQGYLCQVYSQENPRFTLTRWVHQGVEIKMTVQFEDQEPVVTRELISVDFESEIPPELFELPEDYKLREF